MKNIDIVCTSYHKPQIEKMLDVAKKSAEEENERELAIRRLALAPMYNLANLGLAFVS